MEPTFVNKNLKGKVGDVLKELEKCKNHMLSHCIEGEEFKEGQIITQFKKIQEEEKKQNQVLSKSTDEETKEKAKSLLKELNIQKIKLDRIESIVEKI